VDRPFECKNCGTVVHTRHKNRKYCSQKCYRADYAKRFDAPPLTADDIVKPDSYGDFLLGDRLPCLVVGCNWTGKHLSLHVNLAHGMNAEQFKQAAGFNQTTGVVTNEISVKMSLHRHQNKDLPFEPGCPSMRGVPRKPRRFNTNSGEAAERRKAAKKRLKNVPGKKRKCRVCGTEFQTKYLGQSKLYCTTKCRSAWYGRHQLPGTCSQCKSQFDMTKRQQKRADDGLPVFCGIACRQSRNGSVKWKAAPATTRQGSQSAKAKGRRDPA